MRNYKFRLYPNKKKEKLLDDYLNNCRLVYNKCLETKIKHYEETKLYLNKFALDKVLKDWEESKTIYSQVAQEVNARVDKAFQGFFRRLKSKDKAGFPRFKGYGRYDSFSYKQWGNGCKLKDNRLYISKIGDIKIKLHREIEGKIKTCSIKKENNEWYVIFSVEQEITPQVNPNDNIVAYDLGIKHFAVSSDGEYIQNPKHYNSQLGELKKIQKKYSEKKNLPKEDKGKVKLKRKLSKFHKKVKNQRKDFLHKLSRKIVNENKYIVIEDLNTASMKMQKDYFKLSRYIDDCGWSTFTQMLQYKAEEAGSVVVKVNPRNTSQRCSNCGEPIHKDLNDRKHICYSCGIELDRDLNAAYNILSIGRDTLGLSLDAARSLA